jgi:hypothetical protein
MNSTVTASVLLIIDSYLIKITSVVLVIFAIVGHSFNFYIFTRPKFLKESIFRYFLASEIVSLTTIIMLGIYNVPKLLKWNFTSMFCKILTYIFYTIFDFYPWISVLNSIDRLLSLKFESRYKFIKKLKYQLLALFSILFIMLLINIPRIFYDDVSHLTMCSINDVEKGFYIYLSHLIISNLLPSLIMIFCTCFIVYQLVIKKKRICQKITNYNREKNFVKSVLTMDLWFFICITPFTLITFFHYTDVYVNVNNDDLWKLLFHICVILTSIESTCKFFVYYFCNSLFREYFLLLFRFCLRSTS